MESKFANPLKSLDSMPDKIRYKNLKKHPVEIMFENVK
jgi:hypothetical protein